MGELVAAVVGAVTVDAAVALAPAAVDDREVAAVGQERGRVAVVVHQVVGAGHVVARCRVDGGLGSRSPADAVPAALRVHRASGEHADHVGRAARPLDLAAGVQGGRAARPHVGQGRGTGRPGALDGDATAGPGRPGPPRGRRSVACAGRSWRSPSRSGGRWSCGPGRHGTRCRSRTGRPRCRASSRWPTARAAGCSGCWPRTRRSRSRGSSAGRCSRSSASARSCRRSPPRRSTGPRRAAGRRGRPRCR